MSNELWGVGPDARRAARSVVLSASLGVAAFAITFSVALMLGRGLVGSALAALLLPLAVSGAAAVGLAAAFVVATALEQPAGRRRVVRLVGVVTPIAAVVALLVYTADPTADLGRAIGGPDFPITEPATPRPRRSVGVPAPPPVATTPPVPAGPGNPPEPVTPDPVVPEPPAPAPGAPGAPPVAGPVVPPVVGPGDTPVAPGPVRPLPEPDPRALPEEPPAPPREVAEPGTGTPREPEDLSPRPDPRRARDAKPAKPAKKADRAPAACGKAKAAPKGAAKGRPAKTRPPAGRPAACYR